MTIFEFSLKTIQVRLCHPLSESAHICMVSSSFGLSNLMRQYYEPLQRQLSHLHYVNVRIRFSTALHFLQIINWMN
jgi:hypothetical protein